MDKFKNNVGADASVRPTSKARQNKGITLIALVITIIVMLILVAVTISMAVNGGLFDYAGKATGDTQNAIDEEQGLASGKVTIGETTYNSIDEYLGTSGENDEGQDNGTYDETAKDENGLLTVNATYINGGYTAVIPKGFAISSVGTEQTIENGLVIKDVNNNEFVWIPVEKAMVTDVEIAKIKEDSDDADMTDLEAVQSLVNSGAYPMAVQVGEDYKGILYSFSGTDTLTATVYDWTSTTSDREPANLTGSKTWSSKTTVNGTTVAAGTSYVYDSQNMFTLYGVGTYTDTLYQESYNKMVKSVADNGGFYVGRYEMSLYTDAEDNTIQYAQSKVNQTALVDISWYEMYKYERDYAVYNSNLGVTSEMIWGSQWDQMMIFVNGKNDGAETPAKFYVTTTGNRNSGSSSTKTGMNTVDQVANIYDLEASRVERTQEANSYYDSRHPRGYDYSGARYASKRDGIYPTDYSSYESSRTALYIK